MRVATATAFVLAFLLVAASAYPKATGRGVSANVTITKSEMNLYKGKEDCKSSKKSCVLFNCYPCNEDAPPIAPPMQPPTAPPTLPPGPILPPGGGGGGGGGGYPGPQLPPGGNIIQCCPIQNYPPIAPPSSNSDAFVCYPCPVQPYSGYSKARSLRYLNKLVKRSSSVVGAEDPKEKEAPRS